MLVGLAIFCLSSAVLAYEVLLMRLLTIIQWHHFAYMIISVALLGFGAGGTAVAVWRRPLVDRFHLVFQISTALFAVSMAAAFLLAQQVPLNPLEILWDCWQWGYLGATYLLLFLPFFWAASCIVLTFARFPERIPSLYRFDLLGAAAGSLGIIGLLSLCNPLTCLRILGIPGIIAAALISLDSTSPGGRLRAAGWLAVAVILPLAWPVDAMKLRLSEYKGLSAALRVPGARVVAERSGPLGWLTVIASPQVPFRYVPGLSLTCGSGEPPPQLAVFTDGDALSPITEYHAANLESLSYLDCMTSALPYHLLKRPRVLVIGAGGGADVLLGRYQGAATIDAVELDPNMIGLVQRDFADFAGHLYHRDPVRIHAAEGRAFVTQTPKRYDLIQVSLLDSFATAAAGSLGLSENYLYTVEAFQQYRRCLDDGGYLAITRWIKVPPRDSLKLFATGLVALESSGVKHPERHLALIRSWKTSTLLIKRSALTLDDVTTIRSFCEARTFDTDYFPGIRAEQTNRFNLLERSYFYEGAAALVGNTRQDFLRRYKFAIDPATDDHPFFFQFFKWESLRELLSLEGRGGLPLLEWSYPILILTLGQALVASVLLILAPLGLRRRLRRSKQHHCRLVAYFGALGLAFLFVEMAFIQRFILFLGHPLYAVAVVLTAFLLFAGLGSRCSETLVDRLHTIHRAYGREQGIALACGGIVILAATYVAILPPVLDMCLGMSALVKMVITLFLIAPLAFCMGMPFPLGLVQVGEAVPDLLPWAWGINGCASVLSSILATILAMHYGFRMVVVAAVLLYVLAAGVAWRRWPQATSLEEG
jgi:spermidine synthase